MMPEKAISLAPCGEGQGGLLSPRQSPALRSLTLIRATLPALCEGGIKNYRRLSRNTPCSPNMFQNHHGALRRSGRA